MEYKRGLVLMPLIDIDQLLAFGQIILELSVSYRIRVIHSSEAGTTTPNFLNLGFKNLSANAEFLS